MLVSSRFEKVLMVVCNTAMFPAAERDPSMVLILKWGGELTPAGRTQAEELGKAFRCMYPTYGETPGLGLLRLHSTYRHDLKVRPSCFYSFCLHGRRYAILCGVARLGHAKG